MCVSSRLDRDKGFREKEKGQVPKIQRQPKTKITERKIKRKKKDKVKENQIPIQKNCLMVTNPFADLILSKLMPHSLFNDIVLYYRS
jgi:type III secretion system FlhB-like substrate exporter